jgi:hypothetical protein
MLAAFYLSAAATIACGVWFSVKGRGGNLFAALSVVNFLVSMSAVVSVISLYIYRMPSHHCPFCILQKEYYFVGYPIYGAILATTVSGVGAGWTVRYQTIKSLNSGGGLLRLRATLIRVALLSIIVQVFISSCFVVFTGFTLR